MEPDNRLLKWAFASLALSVVLGTFGISGLAGAASGVATFAFFTFNVAVLILLALHFMRRV